MCDFSYKNGGLAFTWKIENFNCFKNKGKLYTPTFFLETSPKTEWTLAVKEDEDRVHVWLIRGPDNGPEDVTLCFSASMSCMDESFKEKGTWSHSKEEWRIIISHSFDTDVTFKELNIRCQLWITSEISAVVQRCYFRTVVAAEQRRIKCVIPQLSTLHDKQELYFPISFTSRTSDSFEMIIKLFKNINTLETAKIDIRICAENEDKKVLMHGKISVIDIEGKASLTVTNRHLFKRGQKSVWHFPCFIDNEKLIEDLYIQDDVLTLECEFTISVGRTISFVEVSREVAHLERKSTDVELTAEGQKFSAHKAILRARSAVFSAMFDSDKLEKVNNLVEISDVDAETLDRMLFFMYSGILQDTQWDNVMKLYTASDKYQILTLKDKCSAILKSTLSVQNACQLLILADMHNDVELQTSAKDFISTNVKKIFPSEEWKTFIGSNLKLACEIMYKACLENI